MTAPDESATRAWDAVDQEITKLAHRVEVAEWRAKAWEGTARNLAQLMEGEAGDGVLALSRVMKAHGLVPSAEKYEPQIGNTLEGKMIGGPFDGSWWTQLHPAMNVSDYCRADNGRDWVYIGRRTF